MPIQKSTKSVLDDALRKLKAAENALAGELEKGGNLGFAYAELSAARKSLERLSRELP